MDDLEHHLEAIKSIQPQSIAVIQSIDTTPLSQALGMVLREVSNQSMLIKDLRADQEAANEREHLLRNKIEELEAALLTKRKTDEANPDASDLEQRLAALEKEHKTPAAALPVATSSPDEKENDNHGLSEKVEALQGKVAALEDALRGQAPPPPIVNQGSGGGGVSKEEFDNLARRLNDKADRSELDAILSSPPSNAGKDEASPDTQGGGDPDLDSLRNLVRVLGERVNNKADQRALDDTNSQIDSVKGQFPPLKAQIDALEAEFSSQRKSVNEIGVKVDMIEPEVKLIGQEMRSAVSELKQEIEELRRQLLSSDPANASLAPIISSGGSSDPGLTQLVREMQIALKSKVDGKDLARISDRLDDLAAALEALRGKEGKNAPVESKTDLSLLEADVAGLKDSVAGLKDDLASKADASKLASLALEMKSALAEGLAPKADRSDLEDLKLRLSMMSLSPASGDNGGEGGGGGGSEGILEAIKAMLGDKADKADLNATREALAAKTAHLEELCDELAARLATLRDAIQESRLSQPPAPLSPVLSPEVLDAKANKAEFDDLAGQVGDLFAELQRMRSQRERDLSTSAAHPPIVAAPIPTKPDVPLGGKAPQDIASKDDLDALAKDIQSLKDQIDMTSHAINTLTVGLEPRSTGQPINAAIESSQGGKEPRESSQGGKEPRDAAGAYERLVKHVGSQAVKRKMDYFDPNVLNDLSVKAAAMDTFLRSPAFNRSGAPDLGLKDLEAQVKKLSMTVKQLKAGAPLQATGRLADPGDHAMLSGKPLMGYRCLACDRPLEGLDEKAGPYLPTTQAMAGRPPTFPSIPSSGGGGSSPPMSPDRAINTPSTRPGTVDTTQVGPRLPPGGWRASQAGGSGSGMSFTRVSQTGEILPRI